MLTSDLPELYDFSLEKQGKKKTLTAFLLWVPILATSSQRFAAPFSEISQAGCGGSHLQFQYSREITELVEGQPGLH